MSIDTFLEQNRRTFVSHLSIYIVYRQFLYMSRDNRLTLYPRVDYALRLKMQKTKKNRFVLWDEFHRRRAIKLEKFSFTAPVLGDVWRPPNTNYSHPTVRSTC